MSSLEEILQIITNNSSTIFDKKGDFTDEGYQSYSKLCKVLFDLESIVGIDCINAKRIQEKLDSIASGDGYS